MGGKIIIELITLRSKTYAYLDDDSNDHKKAKSTKKYVIKQNLMFQNFRDCWSNNKNVYRSQKDLKAIIMMFMQKKLIRLHKVLMMIRDYKYMIGLKHTHMEQMLLKYVKVKC